MKYIGPTEASRRPRGTLWLFRRDNGFIMLAIVAAVLLVWIWF